MYTPQQIQDAGLDRFETFLQHIWDFLGHPNVTPIQADIADWLQHGPRFLMAQAFRGVGKSYITGTFGLWRLLLDPQTKILLTSANQDRANQTSIFMKGLIDTVPILSFLIPRPEQRTSNITFDVRPATVSQSPSVKSVGIMGQLTGSRADLIIADDVEVEKNSYTFNLRERVAELVKEFNDVLKPDGRIIYLGTPQVEETLYNRLPPRGFKVRVWPGEIPESITKYGDTLAPVIKKMIRKGAKPGTPTDTRFDTDELLKRKISQGKSRFALQYLLDTSPASIEKHPLKLKDLIIMNLDRDLGNAKLVWGSEKELRVEDLAPGGFDGDWYHRAAWRSPEMTEYSGTVMAIDPSGTGQDETAYAIVRYLFGQLFLVDIGGFSAGFSENTMKGLAMQAVKFGVRMVIIEKNFGGGMFEQLLRPVLNKVQKDGVSIEEVWHTGQKECRILDVLEPVIQGHRLTVDREVIERDLLVQEDTPRYSFVQQMTRLTRDRGALANDDRIEALSIACHHWVEIMDRDKDKALEDHKQDLLDIELERFMENAIAPGRPFRPQTPIWVPARN